MIEAEDRALWAGLQSQPRDLDEDVTFPAIGHRRAQLVVAPSFEPGLAWDVRVLGDEWRIYRSRLPEVTEATFGEPARLVGYERLEADPGRLRGYVERLMALTLPVGPLLNGLGGLDGTTYHLGLFGDLGSEVRFRWWTKPPPQWGPLVAIAGEMIEAFRTLPPGPAGPPESRKL